jgi:hypothetical protein
VCDDYSCDHVDEVVSADEHHHDPLVAHDEEAHPGDFVPLLGPRFQSNDETRTYVPAVIEVIRVVVGNAERGEPWVAEQEAIQSCDEEDLLIWKC